MKGIEHLSEEKLKAVLYLVIDRLKDSRKKASQLISKEKNLQKLWLDKMSSLPAGEASPEAAKAAKVDAFETELLQHPEAFIHYTIMTRLITLENECREEQRRRCGPRK